MHKILKIRFFHNFGIFENIKCFKTVFHDTLIGVMPFPRMCQKIYNNFEF